MRRAVVALLAIVSLMAGMGALAPARAKRPAFSISGHVTGLYPGATRQLALTVTNRNRFAIKVTSIRVTVGNAGTGCSSRNLVAGRFRGARKVRRRGRGSVQVPIRMVWGAPNACLGTRFHLKFKGRAVKA